MNEVKMQYIDVQAHFLPDFYCAAMRKAGLQKIDNWDIPAWSVESAIEMMDGYGIQTQLLSLSAPGVSFVDGEEACDLSRALNEFAAGTIRKHSPRFGAFATLPLPDVDGALAEMAYALDTLGMDGVALQSNYGGVYLGAPKFDGVFDELNRRKAVVFVHPVRPPNFAPISMGITAPILEYPFDTTRMAANLLRSGTIERCPGMRLIVAHGGGTLAFLYSRLALALGIERAKLMTSFYFDLTAATTPGQMGALAAIAKPERMMMGFDFPFMNKAMNAPFLSALETDAYTPEMRTAIGRENALKLFPRIATALSRA